MTGHKKPPHRHRKRSKWVGGQENLLQQAVPMFSIRQHEVWERKDYSGPWTLGYHMSSECDNVLEAACCKTKTSFCLLPEQGTESGVGIKACNNWLNFSTL